VWRCGLSYLISLMYPGLWAITSCRRVARAAKTRAAIRPLQEQDATDRMLDGRSGDRRPPTTRLAYGPPRRLARGAASLGTATRGAAMHARRRLRLACAAPPALRCLSVWCTPRSDPLKM
jgi:hypothetical protein